MRYFSYERTDRLVTALRATVMVFFRKMDFIIESPRSDTKPLMVRGLNLLQNVKMTNSTREVELTSDLQTEK